MVISICVFSFWGRTPRPAPGLCPWTPLGDFCPQFPCLPLSETNFWLRPCRGSLIFLNTFLHACARDAGTYTCVSAAVCDCTFWNSKTTVFLRSLDAFLSAAAIPSPRQSVVISTAVIDVCLELCSCSDQGQNSGIAAKDTARVLLHVHLPRYRGFYVRFYCVLAAAVFAFFPFFILHFGFFVLLSFLHLTVC